MEANNNTNIGNIPVTFQEFPEVSGNNLTQINRMSSNQSVIDQLEKLLEVYGQEFMENALNVSDKSIRNWKKGGNPSKETFRLIQEMYKKHEQGTNLALIHAAGDDKELIIKLLQRENERLQRDLQLSLGELRHNILLTRAIVEVNQDCMIEILAKQRKMSISDVALEKNRANYEKFEILKAEGSFSYVGKSDKKKGA